MATVSGRVRREITDRPIRLITSWRALVIRPVGEDALDVAQAGYRRAPQAVETGHTVQGDLDRYGNQPLHLFGLAPGLCVITSTSGGVGSGYASTLRWIAEYKPTPTSIIVPRSTIMRLCRLQVIIARTMAVPACGGWTSAGRIGRATAHLNDSSLVAARATEQGVETFQSSATLTGIANRPSALSQTRGSGPFTDRSWPLDN